MPLTLPLPLPLPLTLALALALALTRYASTPVWRALVDLITKTLPDSFSKVGAKHCAALDDQHQP